jgi:outer membrane receptor protein involved in Fe transport
MSALATLARSGLYGLWRVATLAALAVLLLVRPAVAQLGTGVLIGQVVDTSTKQPLVDVVVTATSPALQGEQTVVTDSSGSFRIPNLPPGDYALRYESDKFRPYSRGGIQLRASVTLRVDAELLPETLKAEEVTVVAKAPTVDVGSSRSGVTLTSDFTTRIPVAPPTGKGGGQHSFEQLVDIAPGAHNDLYGASISGTTSVENQYMIDGLSVGDPGFGYNGTPLSIEFLKEVNIVTGGYLPEYGRGGGGIIDVVTKGGSNEFHGSFFGNYTPLTGMPKSIPAQNSVRYTPRLQYQGDFGFDLGGPIIKDKLWFYVGADLSRTVYTITRDLNFLSTDASGAYILDADGLIVSNPIPGTARNYRADLTAGQYIAKLTFTASSDDRFELVHHGTPSLSGGNGNLALDYETGSPLIESVPLAVGSPAVGVYDAIGRKSIFNSFDTTLKWTHSTPDKKLTFDTTVGWHNERVADLPADGSAVGGPGLASTPLFRYRGPVGNITQYENLDDPSICENPNGPANKCPVPSYDVGGPGFIRDRKYNRLQAREVATWITQGLGHHIVKAGLEIEYLGYDSQKSYSGGAVYRQSTGGGSVTDYRGYGGQTAPDDAYRIENIRYKSQSLSFGAFAQDSWSIQDKVTLNAGVRYDTQMLYAEGGSLALSLPNQWSPRVGVIFDPLQNGRSKIYANYAIYYQSLPLDIADRAGSGDSQIATSRSIANCSPNSPSYPASCDNPANLAPYNTQVFGSNATASQNWLYVGTGKTAIDPDLKPESSSELSAGLEYEVFPGARLGLSYIRRWMNNVIEDMSRDNASTYFLGNPGSGIASDFPKAERTYDAGVISFTKAFGENWLAQASYTLSYLRGNWDGLFRAQTGQLDPGINSDFDLQQLTINRTGPLAGDHRHEIKIFLARDIPLETQHHVTIGAGYRGRSGGPTTPLGADPTYGPDEVFILPRGSGPRLPWVHSVDLHGGYTFARTKDQSFSITADIFNILNFQAVTATTERYTQRSVAPITNSGQQQSPYVNGNPKVINPSYLSPTDGEGAFQSSDKNNAYGAPAAYQDPITFRFGVRTTF